MKYFLFILLSLSVCLQSFSQERIPMTLEKTGIYTIPCEVNGLKLRFVFDTGASEVHLSLIEAAFMLKNGFIDEDDFIGKGNYLMADGSIAENSIINLREIKIGNVVINNVTACISSNIEASLLLGQSAIRKLGPYSINGDFLILDSHSVNDLNGIKKITDVQGNVYNGFVVNGVYEGHGEMTYTNGKTYEGEWKLGKRNGYGVLKSKNNTVEYEGQWKEDKRHGHGTTYYFLGGKHVGEYANDIPYGKGISYSSYSDGDSTVAVWHSKYNFTGTKYYKNGETLTGDWIEGYKEGEFIHTYPNGSKVQEFYKTDSLTSTKVLVTPKKGLNNLETYEHFTGKAEKKFNDGVYNGEFLDGNRQGYGIMSYNDGASYNGNWYYDDFEGQGTYIWSSGDKYVGEFQKGWRHGHGVYVWTNGDKYVGQLEKNKRHGKGKMDYASGGWYEGDWVDDVWHGQGTIIYDNGDQYQGAVSNGKRNGYGIIFYKETGNKYDGNWEEGMYEGFGIYSWKTGDRYAGYFSKGLKNGYGTYTWENGDCYEGYWSNNKRNGEGTYYFATGGSKTGIWIDGEYQETCSDDVNNSEYPSSSHKESSDYYGAYQYVPKSYYTAHTTTKLTLREGPNTKYKAINKIPEGDWVFMEEDERFKDFAKVMYINTGEEGYVSSKHLDGFTKVEVNENGTLEVIGKTYNKYADVSLTNDSNVTVKISIGSNSYTLSPNSSKKVKNIESGTYNIMASSPGIIPFVGVDTFEGGYEYSWKFYISYTKQ